MCKALEPAMLGARRAVPRLVDVHIDSSQIVDSVISSYQRSLMNLMYGGDASNRDKVNLILANEITPHLTSEEYRGQESSPKK